jgi:hypothetical protein
MDITEKAIAGRGKYSIGKIERKTANLFMMKIFFSVPLFILWFSAWCWGTEV